MRVLVTGGAGFIGSHVVDRLLREDYSVTVIDDLSSGNDDNLSDRAQFFQQDICDPEALHTVSQIKPDIIVHAAAQMSVSASMKDPIKDVQVNLAGMLNILNAYEGKDLPYFLFISTGGALYGEQEEYPASESHPIRPTSVYGQSKHCAENYLGLWKRVYGLNYGVLRLANVYGPRQNPHGEAGVVAIFLQKLLASEQPTIFGTGEFTRDYVYVSDVVDAVSKMLSNRDSGTYNIGTGIETSVNDLYQAILSASGSTQEVAYADQRAGDQERSVVSAKAAKESLGWEASKSLKEGLEETASWFAKQAV